MKPKKFYRANAHLPVKNLRATLDYYRDTLGFSEEWIFGEIDGGISRDDMRLLFAEDAGFTNNINNERHRLPVMWFVDNIEAIYKEFKERNIPLADDLKIHAYRLKEFAFIDINGYYIRIAESAGAWFYFLPAFPVTDRSFNNSLIAACPLRSA